MHSPEEIRSRTFLVSLRGYDRADVRQFLEEVADQLAVLQQQLEVAERAGGPGEAAPDEATEDALGPEAGEFVPRGPFAEIGEETQRILEAAQSAGEELRRRAHEETQRELKDARGQAARIIAEAERERDEITASVRGLEDARAELAAELRDVGRTLERMLRDLTEETEATTTVRAAMAEAARDDEPPDDVAGPEDDAAARPAGEATPAAPEEPDEGGSPDREGAAVEPERAADGPEEAPTDVIVGPEPDARASLGDEVDGAGEPRATRSAVRVVTAAATPTGEQERRPIARPEQPRTARTAARGVPERVPVQARGDALAPSHPKLVRRLKRGLQDIENSTLDRLRREGTRGDPDRFLPGKAAVAALADLARPHIENAYAVGYHSGTSAIGQAAGDPPALERDLGGVLGEDLVGTARDGLREQLITGFGEDADLQALTERVDTAFAAVRDRLISASSAIALVRAYEWGQHDAWVAFGVERRKWALATEPQCTDPRCEDNAGSGAVPLGEPFPSGHEVPPARPGCSCTTVPLVFRT